MYTNFTQNTVQHVVECFVEISNEEYVTINVVNYDNGIVVVNNTTFNVTVTDNEFVVILVVVNDVLVNEVSLQFSRFNEFVNAVDTLFYNAL